MSELLPEPEASLRRVLFEKVFIFLFKIINFSL